MPSILSPAPGRQPVWIPNTNVFIADSGHLMVQVELSSLRSDHLEITVEGFTLRILCHRKNHELAAAKMILVQEMQVGPFESVFELPPQFDLAYAKLAT
jgi:HSP20 family molecular chaperone IbpA